MIIIQKCSIQWDTQDTYGKYTVRYSRWDTGAILAGYPHGTREGSPGGAADVWCLGYPVPASLCVYSYIYTSPAISTAMLYAIFRYMDAIYIPHPTLYIYIWAYPYPTTAMLYIIYISYIYIYSLHIYIPL